MKNRILSVILAALMVMSCFGTFAVSAAEYTNPTVAVECTDIGAEGLEADQFRADIVVYNNPGISGYQYAVKFDNSLIQIVDVVRDEDDVPESVFPAEATLNIDEPGADVTKLSEVNVNASRAKASDKNGVYLSIIFKVVGDFEETTLTIEDELFVAQDQSAVEFDIVNGTCGLPKITGVSFAGGSFVYDGTDKSIAVTGATSDMTVTYSPATVKTAGTHKITATVKKAGYATLTLTANLVITPKALTITGVAVQEKTFDNTTAATVDYSNAALVGVVAGDDVSFTQPTATFADVNVGTNKTMVMDAIALSGAAASNYTLTQPTLKGVIIQRTVTIVPNPGQGKKVGAADTEILYTVDGDLCGYTLTGALGRVAGEDAGELSKTYAITLGTLKTSPDDGNIKLVVADEVYTIFNKDPQTVEVTIPATAVYGTTGLQILVNVVEGNTAISAISATSSNEDVVTVDAFGAITVVGVGKATITVTVAGNDTYAPFTYVGEIEITGIPVTVTPLAGQVFTYGDAVEIEYTADVDGVPFTGALALASTKAGDQKVVIGTLAAKNYTITVASATVVINRKEVTLTGVELWPTKTPEINMNTFEPAISGAISGDDVYIVTGTVAVKQIRNNYVVEGLTLGGADADNYMLDGKVEYNYTSDQAAAEYIANFIAANADIVDTGSDMTTADLINQILGSVVLPTCADIADVTATPDVIDANGNIVRPEEDTVVTFTFTVEVDGATATFTKTVTITSSKDNARLLALMYYYYMMNQNKQGTVASVKANVASGDVVKGTAVTLTTETAGATIYYTTDGKTPTTASNVYTAPIVINETVTIKAIAVKAGMNNSGMVTFTYKAVDAKTTIALKKDAATIKYLAGYADGTFKPNQAATRYEVVVALNNVFDITTNATPKTLTDVSADMKAIIDTFTAAGIIDGFTDGEFKGNESITRAQFAKIVAVMLDLDIENAKDAGFSDVSGWAAPYINACAEAKLVIGNDDGTFAPSRNITRAELATLINRITGAKAGTECAYSDVLSTAWYFGYVAAAAK